MTHRHLHRHRHDLRALRRARSPRSVRSSPGVTRGRGRPGRRRHVRVPCQRATPLAETAVRDAVDEAGYDLVGRR